MDALMVFVHVKNRDQETKEFHMYPAFCLYLENKTLVSNLIATHV
jgi:hypothetical protein